jgi:3-phosphoshikimate 1-carboxyvinyltransferase
VPGDKSVGHRALLFGALAEGPSTVRGLSTGLDNRATMHALRMLGVPIDMGEQGEVRIQGVGLHGLRMASGALDCGNSGTTMRLLAGLLAGQRFGSRLTGDASLCRRPMGRIVGPLRARGSHIAGTSDASTSATAEPSGSEPDETEQPPEVYPPLSIAPLVEGEELVGLEYDMPTASAQVKSALLLSGLYAEGGTALKEPVVSRDHTERMMTALGVPLQVMGPMVALDPEGWSRRWDGFDWDLPGDLSSAAFLLAAAHAAPSSEITIEKVGTNPTRTGILEVLRMMGAAPGVVPKGDMASNEPVADLMVETTPLRGQLVAGELLVRSIDEVPAVAVLAALAHGTTEVRDAAELRVKESDRIATMAAVLRAFGVRCEELEDGLRVHGQGGRGLQGAHVRSGGDHRVAMAATVLGLAADGPTLVDGVECVETSFPGFAELLRSLGAEVEQVDEPGEGEA